jgi:hypothetical protein
MKRNFNGKIRLVLTVAVSMFFIIISFSSTIGKTSWNNGNLGGQLVFDSDDEILEQSPLEPPLPHAFHGTLKINGEDTPIGTMVRADGEGVVHDDQNPLTTYLIGYYGGPGPFDQKLIIQGDIAEGTILTFYVNNVSTEQTHEWHSGEVTLFNLTVTIDIVPPEIINVQAIPFVQNIGGYVNISATVIDNIAVHEVYLYIEYPDSSIENFPISQNKTGDIYYCNKTYDQVGNHSYHIWANDTSNNTNISSDYIFIVINQPPNIPMIDGQTSGKAGAEYEYTFNAVDPDGDDVKYFIDWGDNTIGEWTGFNVSGTDVKVKHTWSEEGTYNITARAKDIYGLEGPEGTLEVTMPKNKPSVFIFNLFGWLLERFPNAFFIIRYILGL